MPRPSRRLHHIRCLLCPGGRDSAVASDTMPMPVVGAKALYSLASPTSPPPQAVSRSAHLFFTFNVTPRVPSWDDTRTKRPPAITDWSPTGDIATWRSWKSPLFSHPSLPKSFFALFRGALRGLLPRLLHGLGVASRPRFPFRCTPSLTVVTSYGAPGFVCPLIPVRLVASHFGAPVAPVLCVFFASWCLSTAFSWFSVLSSVLGPPAAGPSSSRGPAVPPFPPVFPLCSDVLGLVRIGRSS